MLAGALRTNRDQAAALLLGYIAKENDAYAFRQMHGALVTLTGTAIELPFGAAKDPSGRRAIVERLGAEFLLGMRVESAAALDELQARFDAVLLAGTRSPRHEPADHFRGRNAACDVVFNPGLP